MLIALHIMYKMILRKSKAYFYYYYLWILTRHILITWWTINIVDVVNVCSCTHKIIIAIWSFMLLKPIWGRGCLMSDWVLWIQPLCAIIVCHYSHIHMLLSSRWKDGLVYNWWRKCQLDKQRSNSRAEQRKPPWVNPAAVASSIRSTELRMWSH